MKQKPIANRLYSVVSLLSSVFCQPSNEIQSTKHYVRNYQRIMQNKPNSPNVQIYINIYETKDYQNFTPLAGYKNKPNSNPIKPNLRKVQMNVNLTLTKDYRKKDDFAVRINKPNFQNGQNECKITYNKGLQRKRLFSSPKNKPNSNPIKACPQRIEFTLSVIEGNGPILERMNLNLCVPVATAENCMYHISSLEVTIGDD